MSEHISDPKRKDPKAGGFFILLGVAIGAVSGAFQGALMLYTLIGLFAGILLSVLIWLRSR